MSDTYPKQRGSAAGLDSRDNNTASSAAPSDPLAELARLVGRDDPFRDLFPARDNTTAQSVRSPRPSGPPMLAAPEPYDRFPVSAQNRRSEPFNPASSSASQGFESGFDDPSAVDDSLFHTPLGQDRHDSFHLPALAHDDADYDPHGYGHDAGIAAPAPLNADLWAQGMPEPVSADPLQFVPPLAEVDAPEEGSRRRTMIVLASVLALTMGGLGATFLMRGGHTSVAANGEPPTILADTGPAKIQPPDTTNQSTGGDGNTALIEKSASDNVSKATVVNTQERPVDLAQLPKAPAAATAPAAASTQPDDGRVAVTTTTGGTAGSAFPEPRKVKTILIRPDGSVVGDNSAPAAAGGDVSASTPGGQPAARPATPKATTRAATTSPGTTATPSDTSPTKPKVVHPKPKPAAAVVADAGAAADAAATTPATAPAGTGSFAVQLAAPATEQEAKDASTRLSKKFAAELEGRPTSIRKADNKSVYRVRVGNMSQDDAKALCSKLQAGGGSCFVVRN